MSRARDRRKKIAREQKPDRPYPWVAYHEAGHAVMSLVLGARFIEVLVQTRSGETPTGLSEQAWGGVHFYPDDEGPEWCWHPQTPSLEACLGQFLVFWAGVCVQAKHQGLTVKRVAKGSGGGDAEQANAILAAFRAANPDHDDHVFDRLFFRLHSTVEDIIRRPEIWNAITVLAEALMERHRLSFEEVLQVTNFNWTFGVRYSNAVMMGQAEAPDRLAG